MLFDISAVRVHSETCNVDTVGNILLLCRATYLQPEKTRELLQIKIWEINSDWRWAIHINSFTAASRNRFNKTHYNCNANWLMKVRLKAYLSTGSKSTLVHKELSKSLWVMNLFNQLTFIASKWGLRSIALVFWLFRTNLLSWLLLLEYFQLDLTQANN